LRLKNEVLGKQTVLGRIYRRFRQDSLFDYANNWQVSNTDTATEFRKPFFTVLQELSEKIYGKTVSEAVTAQLERIPVVSTIDHHGLLNHPFFLNSNLIFSLRADQKYLICLSTAGVSLNNSSWPASLVVTGNRPGKLIRFSFFPDRQKTKTVLATPKFDERGVKTVIKRIAGSPDLTLDEKKCLFESIEEIFLSQNILSLPDFSSQASVTSGKLWSKIFPQGPEILYVPIEELMARVITEEFSKDAENVIYKLLFTEFGHNLIEKYFQSSLGAFSSAHKGSFLFWGINNQGRRVHLRREGERLADGDFFVHLNPKAVVDALRAQKIYPTSLICFLVLLYYGITCLGGFNQVNWLEDIKNKFILLLKELGESQLATTVVGVSTDNFAEGNLAFLRRKDRLIKATGMDIILAHDRQLFERYQQLARQITVGESIESLLPEIYRVITAADNRESGILSLTDEDIARQNGMEEKIRKII
jgi:hypothetical protein